MSVQNCNIGSVGKNAPEKVSKRNPYTSDYRAFSLMSGIFFVMGFITCMNDVLIPHLKASFNLTYAQAMMVQSVWFATVLIVSLPAGWLISRYGYKRSAIISLLIAATGLSAMWPAAEARSYNAFLAALFVVASGTTLMQIVLNPYITLLGSPEKAASRLTLAQALNSLGTFLAPFFGSVLILSSVVTLSSGQLDALSVGELAAYRLEQADVVKLPYIGIAIFLVLMALLVMRTKLPTFQPKGEEKKRGLFLEALKHRQVKWGVLGIFCYVGAEVAIGSFMINYLSLPHIGNMLESSATTYVALYWGGAMVGRVVGAAIMAKFSARRVLAIFAIINVVLLSMTMAMSGIYSLVFVVMIGLFNSVMFASIFTMSVNGLGHLASPTASILIMAEVGGAIIPFAQGYMADRIGVQYSFVLPLVCYVCILLFAIYCHPASKKNNANELATF